MSEEQTGMNNAFDEALKDFVEGRRARARLPKNHRTLAASLRKKLKVREPEVGRLPDALFPVSTTQPEATRWRLEVTVRSIHGQTGLHALGNFLRTAETRTSLGETLFPALFRSSCPSVDTPCFRLGIYEDGIHARYIPSMPTPSSPS